ncbi:MAG: hypothetical protein Q9161_007804 [Pseudevernia consocians]
MAAQGSDEFASGITETQPTGPLFVDNGGCRCALQETLGKESWRCIANTTSNIYSGQTGRWFFAADQDDPASLQELPNSDSNPPNLGTSYVIEGEGQNAEFVLITSKNETTDLGDITCSAKNDSDASSYLYQFMAVSATDSLSPCWQPGTIPLIIQNARQWNAKGCNLGFLCECANSNAPRSLQKSADGSFYHRPEQHSSKPTNLLPTFSPRSSR